MDDNGQSTGDMIEVQKRVVKSWRRLRQAKVFLRICWKNRTHLLRGNRKTKNKKRKKERKRKVDEPKFVAILCHFPY